MTAQPQAGRVALSETPVPAVTHTRPGAWLLALGFLGFGVAVGGLTGFSSAQGITLTLLSSLFTFVGGVVLSFAGFRRAAGAEAAIDPARVGAGLGCLSLGIVLGAVLGVYGRCNVHAQSLLLGERVSHSQCVGSGPSSSAEAPEAALPGAAGLMAAESDACQQAAFKLEYAILDKTSERGTLEALMSKLNQACKLGKR